MAVHFDPKLRDEVVARYQRLSLPTYFAGINPDIAATVDGSGEISAVEISYPRDEVKQQLSYSAFNSSH